MDDEGERRVGGFFIDRIGKNLMKDEQAGEKLTRGNVSNCYKMHINAESKFISSYITQKVDIFAFCPSHSDFKKTLHWIMSQLIANHREKLNFLFEQLFHVLRTWHSD